MPSENSPDKSVESLDQKYPVYHPLSNPKPTTVPAKGRVSREEGLATPNMGISPVDPVWQNIDPTPDIRSLFTTFDAQFFGKRLSSVEVRWSPRMTLCAGQCIYEGPGGLCSIRLSEPLLKFRPRSDLVETLLHEMIHAYLFVTQNKRDRSAHGPSFQFHMNRINKIAKTNITIYHSFHDEVDNYKVHWWKCNGPCAKRPPFYGLVRRSMNRAPGPNDLWWAEHQATCSGQFIKISEPENPKNASKKGKNKAGLKSQAKTSDSSPDLLHFFQSTLKPDDGASSSAIAPKTTSSKEPVVPFTGVGHRLGGLLPSPAQSRLLALTAPPPLPSQSTFARSSATDTSTELASAATLTRLVQCPVCFQSVPEDFVNEHLDACLVAV
ncbi:unnamed protein product [Hydatigera taeniaeformis]|uniref:Protein with SprT-like domain at the N terminus n=1 Tax=Hydatigena taeniaeformis TaxID=6205 RepID=A0A0R3WJQ8_HYDTA|nr:unnamed protein product [Hydatigera taeniaeformis]